MLKKAVKIFLFVAVLMMVVVAANAQDKGKDKKSSYKEEVYTLKVNYDRSIEKGLDAGHYFERFIDPDINSNNFSINKTGTEKVQIHLVYFGEHKIFTTKEIIAKLDKKGFRPANIQECLAMGEQFPMVQCRIGILFFGSSWTDPWGHVGYPCLESIQVDDPKDSCDKCGENCYCCRYVYLDWYMDEWVGDYCYFAAIKK